MNKSLVVRWLSVVVVGALAVGCGHPSDRASGAQAQAPAACVPPPADTLKAPAATAPAATVATAPAATAAKTAAKDDAAKGKSKASSDKKLADAKLVVRRLVVAEGIERSKREPVGAKQTFKAADLDRLYAFVEVDNPSKAESQVFVTFEPQDGGTSQGQVSLDVGAAPRWRTWAYTRGAKKAGSWAAVVRSTDGTVLARTPFDVTL